MGTPSYGVDYEGQYDFLQIGTITSAETALGVDERDNASVEDLAVAKKVIWRPDQGTAAAILRFRTDGTEDDAPVIEMYGAKGADYYTRIGTLTLAQGTQDWSGGHFVDEITLSNEAWAHGIRANSVTDEVGRVLLNTGGFDRFLFIASTLVVTTIHIDIARLDKQIDHGIEIHSAILVLADNMTVSDVVSAISDMHSDLTAQNDSIIDQVTSTAVYTESCADDLESIAALMNSVADELDSNVALQNSIADELDSGVALLNSIADELDSGVALLNSVADNTDSVVDYISSLVTGVETVETTLNTISGAIDSTLDYTSSLVTGVETVNTNLVAVKSAISDGLSAQFSSIITELEGIETTLNAISGHTDSVVDYISSLVTGVETVNTNLGTLENDVVSVHSVIKRTNISTANSDLWISDIASATDGTRLEVSNAISNLKDAVNLTTTEVSDATSHLESTLSNSHSNLLAAVDDNTVSVVAAVDLVTTEVSDAASALIVNDDLIEAGIRSGVTSALSNAVSELIVNDDLIEAGIRSGVKSVMTDNETAMRSAITSALSNAVSELVVNDDLIEAGIRSGVKSTLIITDVAIAAVETEVKSAADSIISTLVLHEAGVRSGVKSALIVTDAAVAAADATSAVLAMDSALSGAFVTLESTLDNLVAVPIEKTPVLVTQFVAVSGTAEALIGSETFARAVYLQARKVAGDNTGNIFIGLSDLDQGVAELFEVIPGGTYELVMPAGCKVDLNDIYVDADNADDGVVGYYIPV